MKRMKRIATATGITLGITLMMASGNAWGDNPEYLITSAQVYVLEGPLENGQILGTNTIGINGTIALTALGLSDGRSIEGTLLRYDNGTSAMRTLAYFWSADGGTFSNTGSATTVWYAPNSGGTYTIICVISEPPVVLGRPVGVSYGTRTVTSEHKITCVAPVLSRIVVNPATATVEAGGTQSFSCQGYDQYNNPITGTYTWSTTVGVGTLSTTTGTRTIFTATTTVTTGILLVVSGTVTQIATITVVPGVLSYIIIDPATATVMIGATRTFTARGYDCWGNELPNLVVNWHVDDGQVSPITGTYTVFTASNEAGTVTLTAEKDGVVGTATITVFIPSIRVLTKIVITPGTVTVKAGGTQSFSCQGYDQYNDPITGTYTWSTTVGVGTLSTTTGTSTIFVATTTVTTGILVVVSGTVTQIATITVVPGDFAAIKYSPIIQELHVGTYSTGGTITMMIVTLRLEDLYGNMVDRSGTWTVYCNLDGGQAGDTNPGNASKRRIEPGADEVSFPLYINPKKYGWVNMSWVVYTHE